MATGHTRGNMGMLTSEIMQTTNDMDKVSSLLLTVKCKRASLKMTSFLAITVPISLNHPFSAHLNSVLLI